MAHRRGRCRDQQHDPQGPALRRRRPRAGRHDRRRALGDRRESVRARERPQGVRGVGEDQERRDRLGYRGWRQHAAFRRRDAARVGRRDRHRPVQERLGGRDRRAVQQRPGDLRSEHRRAAAGEGGQAEGHRDHVQPPHKLLRHIADGKGAGFRQRGDRPLGRALRTPGNTSGDRRADEQGTRGRGPIRRFPRKDGARGHRARAGHHRKLRRLHRRRTRAPRSARQESEHAGGQIGAGAPLRADIPLSRRVLRRARFT